MFKSSEVAERGFCRDCGTPLFYRAAGKDRISVSLGSLDDPSRVVPLKQFGIESRLPFIATLAELPGSAHRGRLLPRRSLARLKSRQHPDAETGSDL